MHHYRRGRVADSASQASVKVSLVGTDEEGTCTGDQADEQFAGFMDEICINIMLG